jgi:hypothetical protein
MRRFIINFAAVMSGIAFILLALDTVAGRHSHGIRETWLETPFRWSLSVETHWWSRDLQMNCAVIEAAPGGSEDDVAEAVRRNRWEVWQDTSRTWGWGPAKENRLLGVGVADEVMTDVPRKGVNVRINSLRMPVWLGLVLAGLLPAYVVWKWIVRRRQSARRRRGFDVLAK